MSDQQEPGADLVDRWFAHHQQTSRDRTPPRAPAVTDEGPAPTPAEPVATDPLFDDAFTPEEREPAHLFEATAPAVALADFEPVIIPSARKRAEAKPRRRAKTPPPVAEDPPVEEPVTETPAPVAEEPPVEESPTAPTEPLVVEPLVVEPHAAEEPAEEPPAEREPVAKAEPSRRARPRPAPAPAAAAEPPFSGNMVFPPRTGARRVAGLVLLAALVATAVTSYAAYQSRSTPTIGIATTLGVLTLVVWAVRAGSTATRLSVTAGQLEVLRGGGRFVFDLRSPHMPIEVVGEPGERGWKVLFHRRSMAPFVVDSSMVDPAEFMRVFRHHRPEGTSPVG